MLFVQIVLTLVWLTVCSFAPGFFFIRRLRWSSLEKLCGSVGLSLILIYLLTWGLYCFAPFAGGRSFAGVSLVCAGLGIAVRRDIRRLLHSSHVRRALGGFAFLLLWSSLLLALVRVYSGADWSGDWVEHFQRSLFFLHHFPLSVPIFPFYLLPSRPPMMNVIAAFFLGQSGDSFQVYQVVFLFLNLLLFLPCYLLMPALAGAGRRRAIPLLALFAASPVVMQNVTYSWTKAFTAFFVVLAIWFYLAAWRKKDSLRMVASFLALSAGALVHYSAGAYCVFFASHYLVRFFREPKRPWRQLAAIAVVSASMLATWFGWSIRHFGIRTTLTANTAWVDRAHPQDSKLIRIGSNLFDSLIPPQLRAAPEVRAFGQPSFLGYTRDWAFMFYQSNLIFGLGVLGGPIVLWLLRASFRNRKTGRAPERSFWLAMISICILLGIAVVGERSRLGVAHVTLLPIMALGLAFLAANFSSLRRIAAVLLIAGCTIDFSLGVLLQAHVEGMENTREKVVFSGLTYAQGLFTIGAPTKDSLSRLAWRNWLRKHQYALNEQWIQELPRQHGQDPVFALAWPPVQASLERSLQSDRVFWQGWLEGHGGVFEYLGDSVAEISPGAPAAIEALLALLFLGLVICVTRAALSERREFW